MSKLLLKSGADKLWIDFRPLGVMLILIYEGYIWFKPMWNRHRE
jgi:hypothetical protein